MKAAAYILLCVAVLYSCAACSSTGAVDVYRETRPAPAVTGDEYEQEVKRNFPNARAIKVADSFEISLSRDSISYVTGPTEQEAWRLAALKLR